MDPNAFAVGVGVFMLTFFCAWVYHMHVCLELEVKVNEHKSGERAWKSSYEDLKEKYNEALDQIQSLRDDRRAALCKSRDYENKISKVKAALDLKDGEFIYTT